MALQFYFGPSGSGKSTALYDRIVREAAQHEDRDYLILVPEQFTMQTQKDLVIRHSDGGIMNIDVLSFGRLFYRVAEETGVGMKPVLNDIGKALILRKIASDQSLPLTALARNIKRIGYINEVKSAISEFMQYSVSPMDLLKLIETPDISNSLKGKLKDLSLLYERFLQYLGDHYITTEESMDRLSEYIPDSSRIKHSVVVLDGYTGFTPVQMKVIRALLNHALNVIVTVEMDGAVSDPLKPLPTEHLFALSSTMVQKLLKICDEDSIDRISDVILPSTPVYRYREVSDMAYLEQNLFRNGNAVFEGDTSHIKIHEMTSMREEVRDICIEIRRLVREGGYRYRDIAVVTADMESYAPLFEEAMERYEIPYFLDQTRKPGVNPLPEYIRSTLMVFYLNFSYDSMMRYLRCGLSGITEAEADVLDYYCLSQGIRGISKWNRAFTKPLQDGEEGLLELEQINALRSRVMERLEPMKSICTKQNATAAERVRKLYDFLESAGAAEYLDNLATSFEERGDMHKAIEYRQIYKAVMMLLEQLHDILGEETIDLKEFYDLLEAGFHEIKIGIIPQNADRIMIGDMQRTRLDRISHVFLCGVNDGNIPKSSSGGILSVFDREFFKSQEVEMAPLPREEMYIQRLYLYLLMTKPLLSLHLSYCTQSASTDEKLPSYIIGTLLKMYPKLQVVKPERCETELSRIECRDDGVQYYIDCCKESKAKEELASFVTMSEGLPLLREELLAVEDSLFVTPSDLPLSGEAAVLLYGTLLSASISRLETFATCAFCHFLTYGLQLGERPELMVDNRSIGSVMHLILSELGKVFDEDGVNFQNYEEGLLDQYLSRAIVRAGAADATIMSPFSQSKASLYCLEQIKNTVRHCVLVIRYQLNKGSFVPKKFEYDFSHIIKVDPASGLAVTEDGREIRLGGIIDRMDVCNQGDKCYIRIIDYKSSAKTLDFQKVYTGEQLQLLVYLNGGMETYQKELAHDGINDISVIPAGVLYFKLTDEYQEYASLPENDEQIQKTNLAKNCHTGLVTSDMAVIGLMDDSIEKESDVIPVSLKKEGLAERSMAYSETDMNAMMQYVDKKITEMAGEIMAGVIKKNPFKDSCTYCNFRDVCNFRCGITEDEVRGHLKAKDALNKILGREDR